MRRSDQRRAAVFRLYAKEIGGDSAASAPGDLRPFTRDLVAGVEEHRVELDEEIARLAKGWSLDRIAALEKNIMRVALYEARYRDDVPVEVAIDEAVSLARRYCGADAPGFVNGILAAAVRAEPA